MNEMSDVEISRRLAIAIGWEEDRMEESARGDGVILPGSGGEMWRNFDYRDPAVIWPIAERFAMFPRLDFHTERWYVEFDDWHGADTAAKAVAIAVIKAKEQE